MSKFRGRIATQNSCTSRYTTVVDMRFTQTIRLPGVRFLDESNFKFIIDFQNLGNLLNDDWGRVEQIGFPFTKQVVNLNDDLGPNGELIYDSFRDESQTVFNLPSLWKIQMGVSFNF
ncbi:MAG: hypothetical protein IH820_11235 [Bacteroidetes bacterium]|nr:hypothetical protein [Bacteroidota bacterium]